jgi:hypothetical protein
MHGERLASDWRKGGVLMAHAARQLCASHPLIPAVSGGFQRDERRAVTPLVERDSAWNGRSGRGESNPRNQLGRLGLYH